MSILEIQSRKGVGQHTGLLGAGILFWGGGGGRGGVRAAVRFSS